MTKKKDDENLGSFYMGRMRPPPEPERMLPKGALTVVTVLSFIAIIWYAYPQGDERYTGMDVPTITADNSSYKSKPENPGGMEIRHQDSTVFDSLDDGAGKKTVERLLPKEETPMDKSKLTFAPKEPKLNLKPQLKETAGLQTEKKAVKKVKSKAKPKPAPKKTVKSIPEFKKPTAKVARILNATIEPASGKATYYVQIGSYQRKAGATSAWKILKGKYPSQLSKLKMRTERIKIDKKGTFYRLQAGKVTEAHARKICADLSKRNPGGCFLVR